MERSAERWKQANTTPTTSPPTNLPDCGVQTTDKYLSFLQKCQEERSGRRGTRKKWSALRANCKGVYQERDSRFRGNDIALKLFSVMPAQAGIQDLLLLRVNANEIRSRPHTSDDQTVGPTSDADEDLLAIERPHESQPEQHIRQGVEERGIRLAKPRSGP